MRLALRVYGVCTISDPDATIALDLRPSIVVEPDGSRTLQILLRSSATVSSDDVAACMLLGEPIAELVYAGIAGSDAFADSIGEGLLGGLLQLIGAGAFGGLILLPGGVPLVVAILESVLAGLMISEIEPLGSSLSAAGAPLNAATLTRTGVSNELRFAIRLDALNLAINSALRPSAGGASSSPPLILPTFSAEIQDSTITGGLSLAYERDGLQRVLWGQIAGVTIETGAKFRWTTTENCDPYAITGVFVTNPSEFDIWVQTPVVFRASALSSALRSGAMGWIALPDGSRQNGSDGQTQVRWWRLRPYQTARFSFALSVENVRNLMVATRGEAPLEFMVVTTRRIETFRIDRPLEFVAPAATTMNGLDEFVAFCRARVMQQRTNVPAGSGSRGMDLVEQFRRERIESRFVQDTDVRFDAPGLVPQPGGGGLPTPVNPQLQPWESGIPLPSTAFDANPGVFALLMQSVTQHR